MPDNLRTILRREAGRDLAEKLALASAAKQASHSMAEMRLGDFRHLLHVLSCSVAESADQPAA